MVKTILTIRTTHYPIRGSFTISRGSKVTADVIHCFIRSGRITGKAECVPYPRYGETLASVEEEIAAIRPLVEKGTSHVEILAAMKPGAARNAIDCAFWDLKAKTEKTSVASMLGIRTKPLVTAFTLSLAAPDVMYHQARENANRPLLKIKVGGKNDPARIKAVRQGAPNACLIIDANEGWNEDNLAENLDTACECNITLIEQPLPAGQDAYLKTIEHKVALCADESLHTTDDLEKLIGLYDAINIKLDKTGGLTEALHLKKCARRYSFQIMVGCMVASSLSIAPAVLLAQDADFVDLDGPLLLTRDCEHGLRYDQYHVFASTSQLWG